MSKKLLSTSVLVFLLAYGCASSPELTQISPVQSDSVESFASGSKTIKFKHDKIATKSPDINPSPKEFSVTIKKLTAKNSANPSVNQVYNILSSAIENLAQMDVSFGQTDGSDNYEHAKAMSDFVKNTNNSLIRIASSDAELQGVSNVMTIMNMNYSYNKWSGNNKFTYKYADQKFFNALTYKFLLDNFDGDGFNLTLQKVAGHFSQFPTFTQDFFPAQWDPKLGIHVT